MEPHYLLFLRHILLNVNNLYIYKYTMTDK